MLNNEAKLNWLDFDLESARQWFIDQGEQAFRGNQLIQAIHQQGISDIADIKQFSLALRSLLLSKGGIRAPMIQNEHVSADGTIKWLVALEHHAVVETVYIPEDMRATLCISSQVGCALDCSFCATGKQGFNRNLRVSEIIGQLLIANKRLKELGLKQVSNVVMMGMGEPLLNEAAVVSSCRLMLSDYAYGLSKYRVTISTSGLVAAMRSLYQKVPVSLAVSLHAPYDELRNQLVPINKKYPLQQLLHVCQHYFAQEPRRKVMFEYVMIHNVNDQSKHANALIKCLANIPCKINLIPFNPFAGSAYRCSDPQRIADFQAQLKAAGYIVTVRKTRGDDVSGACGQLSGQGFIVDKTFRTEAGRARRAQRVFESG